MNRQEPITTSRQKELQNLLNTVACKLQVQKKTLKSSEFINEKRIRMHCYTLQHILVDGNLANMPCAISSRSQLN